MSHHPTIAIVGSGPIGSAYARAAARGASRRARRDVRGRPAADRHPRRERPQHRRSRREGARARDVAGPAGRRAPRVARHPRRASSSRACSPRAQGTHLIDFGGEGSGHAPTFPAAAASTNVGGMGAHWTCAIPSPGVQREDPVHRRRRVGRAASQTAEDLLHVQSAAFADSAVGGAIRVAPRGGVRAASCPRATARARCRSPATRSPTARCAGRAPTSCSDRSSTPSSPLASALRRCATSRSSAASSATDGRVTGVTVEDLRTGETSLRARRRSWSSPPTRSARRSCCGHPASVPRRSGTTSPSIPS